MRTPARWRERLVTLAAVCVANITDIDRQTQNEEVAARNRALDTVRNHVILMELGEVSEEVPMIVESFAQFARTSGASESEIEHALASTIRGDAHLRPKEQD